MGIFDWAERISRLFLCLNMMHTVSQKFQSSYFGRERFPYSREPMLLLSFLCYRIFFLVISGFVCSTLLSACPITKHILYVWNARNTYTRSSHIQLSGRDSKHEEKIKYQNIFRHTFAVHRRLRARIYGIYTKNCVCLWCTNEPAEYYVCIGVPNVRADDLNIWVCVFLSSF